MTNTLAISSSSTSSPSGIKRRRLDGTAYNASFAVGPPTYRRLGTDTPDAGYQRYSTTSNPQSPSARHTYSRQTSRAGTPSERDASLVLVGTKGSGLSSFAVIAATALRFRLIDTESWLVEHYRMKRSEYIKKRGLDAYRKVSSKALEDILQQNGTRCVLVCGPEALEPHCQALIRTFALTHPVVMINRDLTVIRDYLGLPDTSEVLQILGQGRQLCRRISSHEFFNLPESEAASPLSAELCQNLRGRTELHNPPQLLQNVKQDFLHFLNLLSRTPARTGSLLGPSLPSNREFSTLLMLRLEDIADEDFSLVDLNRGTDAVELAVRFCPSQQTPCQRDRISRTLQMIRRHSETPIVYHVECQDSALLSSKQAYIDLLYHGLRLVPEFITINLDCTDRQVRDLTTSMTRTQVIGHRVYSAAKSSIWTNPALHKEFDRAVALGCHIVRFVCEAKSASEDRACALFQAVIASRSKTPLIAYTTGIPSKSSMVLNPCLTSVRQPGIPNSDSTMSLLTYQQLMKAKFSSYIYQPLHFHIFGASVDYSLSPMMHNAAFDALAMDHNYSFKQSHDLRDFNSLVDDSFGGSSISLPFKSEILSQLDSTSQAAKAIQAVNTLLPLRAVSGGDDVKADPLCRSHKNRAGSVVGLHGENTDWTAIYTCVSRYLSPANTIQPSSSALIIGAGGMARASVYALLQMGVRNIVLWNRTHSKAVRVAEHFTNLFTGPHARLFNQSSTDLTCRIEVVETLLSPWPEGIAQPTIVVCTIPAHQIGDTPPPEFEIPQQWFQSRTGGVIVEVSTRTPHARAILTGRQAFVQVSVDTTTSAST
jgi:shikimate 5-dehydrogenase/shikimate kinase